MFIPLTDLYEFKIVIVNNEIKIIYIRSFENNGNLKLYYYDYNYNILKDIKNNNFNISFFQNDILNKLKEYALKLSEDFPNFIRVDLYVFHNKIYLSELTFDHREGRPFLRNNEIINIIWFVKISLYKTLIFKEAAKNWKRIDCDYMWNK